MIQFYCLSVILCIVGGFVLLFSNSEDPQIEFFSNRNFKFGFAAASLIVALLKLINPYPAGKIPILGDFFPMAANAIVGVILILEMRGKSDAVESKFEIFAAKNLRYIAFACIGIGILHFLMPQVIFF